MDEVKCALDGALCDGMTNQVCMPNAIIRSLYAPIGDLTRRLALVFPSGSVLIYCPFCGERVWDVAR